MSQSQLCFGVVLVEGIAEALILPKLAELVLQKYNATNQQAEQIASTLDETYFVTLCKNG